MFTGLIEEIGSVSSLKSVSGGRRLEVASAIELDIGDSVSVNGVCLTAVGIRDGAFSADVGPETLRRTNLGILKNGSRVNLETAVRAGDPLGGHVVTGHVDGLGKVVSVRNEAPALWIDIRVLAGLDRYVIPQGSICIDGMSLTVAELSGSSVSIMLIPETQRNTIASSYRAGASVNVEVDVFARMVEKTVGGKPNVITERYLEEQGY